MENDGFYCHLYLNDKTREFLLSLFFIIAIHFVNFVQVSNGEATNCNQCAGEYTNWAIQQDSKYWWHSHTITMPSKQRTLFNPVCSNEFPFAVEVKHANRLLCSGSLVASDVVLTSASCVAHVQNRTHALTVTASQPRRFGYKFQNPETKSVWKIYVHEKYNMTIPSEESIFNNLALLYLHTEFKPEDNTGIGIIQIPTTEVERGKKCFGTGKTLGFCKFSGRSRYLHLKHDGRKQIPTVSLSNVMQKTTVELQNCSALKNISPNDSLICTDESASHKCSRDDGTPLIFPLSQNFTQYILCGIATGVSHNGVPSDAPLQLYTSTFHYGTWIKNGMELASNETFICQNLNCCNKEVLPERCLKFCSDGNCDSHCSVQEFRCNESNVCINKKFQCDDFEDCSDGSDEWECCPIDELGNQNHSSIFTSPHFICKTTHTCLNLSNRTESVICNNVNDCPDGSDEFGCSPCKSNEFRCANGNCIPSSNVCDGQFDCYKTKEDFDASDELGCGRCQHSKGFKCQNGKVCVPKEKLYDTENDCGDGSDEFGCGECIGKKKRFACGDDDGSCISGQEVCDGTPNCPNRNDELNCKDNTTCPEGQMYCGGEKPKVKCIDSFKKCDGVNDCGNCADETACDYCGTNFSCGDFKCTDAVCNNLVDCQDKSDEDPDLCKLKPFNDNGPGRPGAPILSSNVTLILISCGTLFGVLFFAIVSVLSWKVWKLRHLQNELREASSNKIIIDWSQLEINYNSVLGSGHFGIVYQGTLKMSDDSRISVAVKLLNSDAKQEYVVTLIEEFKIVKLAGEHVNILECLGTTDILSHDFAVVYELCENGNFKDFLENHSSCYVEDVTECQQPIQCNGISWKTILEMCIQICRGMKHLHENNIIHGDLKLQNILVTLHGNVKVGDFGISQQVGIPRRRTLLIYVNSMIPQGESVNPSSDVWLFGILMWDAFWIVKNPGLELDIQHVKYKGLFPCPSGMPWNVYAVMKVCLQINQVNRPTAELLLTHLTRCMNEVHIPIQETPNSSQSIDTNPTRNGQYRTYSEARDMCHCSQNTRNSLGSSYSIVGFRRESEPYVQYLAAQTMTPLMNTEDSDNNNEHFEMTRLG